MQLRCEPRCSEAQHEIRVPSGGVNSNVLPRALYKYGTLFVGADILENQIKQARRLSAEAGMALSYVVSPAETLDFPDGSFDVITAAQRFIYFYLTPA